MLIFRLNREGRNSNVRAPLLTLRTVEDVFLVLTSRAHFPASKDGLGLLARLLEQVNWPSALKIHRETTGYQPKGGQLTTFRVISRVFGSYNFHRKEAQFRVEKAIQKTQQAWVLVKDGGGLEIWLNIFHLAGGRDSKSENRALVGLRLSDSRMRHRAYKREHLPASLRPSVAAAMVLLSEPQDDDVFLDPMCGAGTILIERAQWGRYQQLWGGDIDPQAVAITTANIGTKYKPISVQEWDATQLKSFATQSVNKVVCNLPFGRQIGAAADNALLYAHFLAEMARVLKPGGSMVLLSGDFGLLGQQLRQRPDFNISAEIPMTLLGVKARIFMVRRR